MPTPFESLSDKTLVVARDTKPKGASRDSKPIPFTITKLGLQKLIASHQERYQYVDEYKSRKQMRNIVTPTATPAPIVAPKVDKVTDGLVLTSLGLSAADAIQEVKNFTDKEKLNLWAKGETRPTVNAAINAKMVTLTIVD